MLYSWALICGYRIWFQFHKYFFPCWFYFVFFLNVESLVLCGWDFGRCPVSPLCQVGTVLLDFTELLPPMACSFHTRPPWIWIKSVHISYCISQSFPYPQTFANILHSSNNIKKIPCFSKKLFPHWWEIWVMVFESRNIFTWW